MHLLYSYKIDWERRILIRKVLMVLVGLIFLLGFCVFWSNDFIDAHEEDISFTKQIYYTSIEVNPGDTLWSIAKGYADEDYCSVYEYIKELKAINGLTSNDIQAGQYLTVPYYDTLVLKPRHLQRSDKASDL